MLFGLFRKKNNNQAIVTRQYEHLTQAARRPLFYSDMGVPDTVLGRFEMLTIILILYFRRTATSERSGQEIAQEIIDYFFEDIDHSIRELGVGDTGVPKRVKKFARMYYGRLESYAGALDNGDLEALKAALRRNIRPDESDAPDMAALASYMIEAETALKAVSEDSIATGSALLMEPEPMERT
ncbi:cytochrome b pre-mRNA-processing protein 3 [Ensifer adhaerens]|nr:cytochrome b pre-mRNA-processing protein 3 [Ensifer adhaerens]HZG26972.1 ubiquinol-cytochrome C chaperone family protein [Ensifer sp.]